VHRRLGGGLRLHPGRGRGLPAGLRARWWKSAATHPGPRSTRTRKLVHRGLYAEYNLVYDRGTKFGLETGHDANAVLMSLPPLAKWVYDRAPTPKVDNSTALECGRGESVFLLQLGGAKFRS
jgi:hypothetical protein